MEKKNIIGDALKRISDEIGKFFNSIIDDVMEPNMELDVLAKNCSEKLDKIILKQKAKGSSYIGGSFKISYKDEKSFILSFEMYFKNKEKKFFKQESKSEPQTHKYLTEKAFEELKKKKEIEYEIDEPISKEK